MKPIAVTVKVDRTAAVLAGKSTYGNVTVSIDPATLTQTQRETLVSCKTISHASDPMDGSYDLREDCAGIPEFTDEVVPAVLDAIAKKRLALAERDRAARQSEYLQAVEKMNELINKPDSELASAVWGPDGQVVRPNAILEVTIGRIKKHHDEFNLLPASGVIAQYEKRLKQLNAFCAKTTEALREQVAQRTERNRIEAEKARQAERAEKERLDKQISDWIEVHGTESQKKRHKAKLLSLEEITTEMRDYAFSSLDHLVRFQRMSKSEVIEQVGVEYETREDVEFSTKAAETADEEEFASLEAITKIAKDTYPDAVVELIDHKGWTPKSEQVHVRKSAKVTIQFGEFKFTREYAVPLELRSA